MQQNGKRYLRAKKVAEKYDASVPTVWRWSAQGLIPKPYKLSPGVTAWDEDELDAADAARTAAS